MITVCIPTYNRAASLAKALASAQAQTVREIEIVVVDNHSTDDTERVVADAARSDSRIRYVRHAQNIGMANNFSACIAEARGELIKFLCDDDLLAPQCVATLERALQQPGVVMAACARQMVGDSLHARRIMGVRRHAAVVDGGAMIREILAGRTKIGEPTAVLFRRAEALRGFDARYEQAFDVEMWCHLLRRGSLAYVPEPLCSVQWHAEMATRANIASGRIIEDKRRLFRELLPLLEGGLSRRERWLWDLRMASTLGRMRAAGARPDAGEVAEVFHPRLFRAMVPLASLAWSVAR
jgi:glycosyltransferase involved in cell wall biosynthesis